MEMVAAMTNAEEEVIKWACNLAKSVVAGDYHLPSPMCIAVNTLQDKVWDLAKERGWSSLSDGCSEDFLAEEKKYWKDVDKKIQDNLTRDYSKSVDNFLDRWYNSSDDNQKEN